MQVRNCFLRDQELVTWGDFCECSVSYLLQVRNAGVLSVSELLELALVEAISLQVAGAKARSEIRGVEVPLSDLEEAILGLQTLLRRSRGVETPPSEWDVRMSEIAHWASSCRGASAFGDVFTIRPEIVRMPDDLQPALEELYELPLEIDCLPSVDPLSILEVLSNESREIFCRRNLDEDSPSFRAVATEFGVTGEAIRRAVQRAEVKLADAFQSDEYRPLRWLVSDLRRSIGCAYPVGDLTGVKELEPWVTDPQATALLLWLAGPYKQSDGWILAQGTSLRDLTGVVEMLCDLDSAPTTGDIVSELSNRGVVGHAAHELINDPDRFRIIDGQVFVWGRTIVDKAVTVLSLLGRPATDSEILEHIGGGRSLRSLRNRLMEESAFMRTDRHYFALRKWVLEEYSGISEEIAERIERAGGEADLEAVVAELLATFDISESSIRQYAAAHRFVTNEGRIWLRTDEKIDVPASTPLTVPGTFQPGAHRIRYVVEVTADTIRGSGRGLPRPLALALGASPGAEQNYVASEGNVRVAWRMDSASGPDMGSLRAFCVREGVSLGDFVVLEFDLLAESVDVSVANPAMPINELVKCFTGIDDPDPQVALARALDVHPEAVRAMLRRRGDDALVDALPERGIDPGLQAVLETLTDTISGFG